MAVRGEIRKQWTRESVPLGDGDGSGTPPPTAAAGDGADEGVGAGDVRCSPPTREACALLTGGSVAGGTWRGLKPVLVGGDGRASSGRPMAALLLERQKR